MPKIASFLGMKSGLLCSDCGKHFFHTVCRAFFLTLKKYVNDSAFQPVFLGSFLPLEDQRKCRNILRPPFQSENVLASAVLEVLSWQQPEKKDVSLSSLSFDATFAASLRETINAVKHLLPVRISSFVKRKSGHLTHFELPSPLPQASVKCATFGIFGTETPAPSTVSCIAERH